MFCLTPPNVSEGEDFRSAYTENYAMHPKNMMEPSFHLNRLGHIFRITDTYYVLGIFDPFF